MKRIITTSLTLAFLAILSAMPVMAQNTGESNSRVAYIRKAYQDAVANANKSADNKITVAERNKYEGGVNTTTIEFFYLVDVVEGPDIPYCKLNLLRRTCKGQDNRYEEFLYDPEDESLLFYFISFEQEKGVKCETRWYSNGNGGGTPLQISKYTDTRTGKDVTERYKNYIGMPWDEGFLNRFARDMQEAFNHLTLRGWD